MIAYYRSTWSDDDPENTQAHESTMVMQENTPPNNPFPSIQQKRDAEAFNEKRCAAPPRLLRCEARRGSIGSSCSARSKWPRSSRGAAPRQLEPSTRPPTGQRWQSGHGRPGHWRDRRPSGESSCTIEELSRRKSCRGLAEEAVFKRMLLLMGKGV